MRFAVPLLWWLAACGSSHKSEPTVVGNRAEAVSARVDTPTLDGEYDYQTWTRRLGDPAMAERAVTELETLGHPGAIPALGAYWEQSGRPVRALQVIISLARPLTKDEARSQYVTDFEATGRQASWNAALPFLIKSLLEVDESNPRSVDSASKAADALGEARAPAGLDALMAIALRPVSKKLIAAQVSAIRAIGAYASERARASAALVSLVDREAPPHPRTARTEEDGRALEAQFGLFLGVTAASINALGELRDPRATKSLVLSMYRTPELFTQLRRALVAMGPTAKAELQEILRGTHAEVNALFVAKKLDMAKDFYPAVVLGDFYDPATVPDLLVALERKPAPAYYIDGQPAQTTQYNAIFDALRKIGSPAAAEAVRTRWMTPAKSDAVLQTKIIAVAAYPFVAGDTRGVSELAAIAADNLADDSLRQQAATAFARLARDARDIGVLDKLADRYFKAAAQKRKEADGKPKRDADAADKVLAAAQQKLDAAKSDLIKLAEDASTSAADIKAATAALEKLQGDFKTTKKKHKERTAAFKQRDRTAKDYKQFARMFQTHAGRIEIAIRCKQDLTCFAASLTITTEQAAANAASYIKDIKDWTDDEKRGLVEANIERAMLELGKAGSAAEAHTGALLDAAKSDVRVIRQAVLLALPKIAKVPCATCEAKLQEAIKVGEGKTALGDLNLETTILRNYFSWVGK